MKSRGQVESDDASIAAFTSSCVAGVKSEIRRGGVGGGICGEAAVLGNVVCSLVILSVKKFIKAEARVEADEVEGSEGRAVRQRREFSVFQRFLGVLACLVISVL
jgi:hypothetical protein